MNGAVKWSDESTREFIQLRFKLRHLFNGRRHHCEKAYSRIVAELGLTHIITPAQARKKWSNLLQQYMAIKGGYSTATSDWPYFQILDQIVPVMRKEKIERLPSSSNMDPQEMEQASDTLQSPSESGPLSAAPGSLSSPLAPTITSANAVTPSSSSSGMANDKCKTEAADEGEPPRKRSRGRRAAQRARDRWWGAVEDDDLGSDSPGKGDLATTTNHRAPLKTPTYTALDPSHMELQTINMLESCSSALGDIRDVLASHTSRQEAVMQSLQETVVNQVVSVKDLLTTLTSQNATLISLISQLTSRVSQQPSVVVGASESFMNHKHQAEGRQSSHAHIVVSSNSHSARPPSHSHQATPSHQLLTSQANLISALSQDSQDCDNSLVDNPELADNMAGL